MKTLALRATLVALLSAAGSTTVSAQGYGNQGMPERDCSPEALEYQRELGEQLRTTGTPADTRLQSGLTVAEADALRQEEETLQRREIEQLTRLLDSMRPGHERRAEILYRLAESYRQLTGVIYLAERAVFNECMDNWFACTSDEVCYEPEPDYGTPIEIYRDIARSFPDYNRLDEVFFRLGESLIENRQASEGVQTLNRLVQTYPQSQYIPEAYYMMGDHFFNEDLLIAARQNYDEVMRFPDSDVYNVAIYKLAWVDFNEREFDDMIQRLQTVVRNIDQGVQRTDLRRQALADMLLGYAEIPGGWQDARRYYEAQEGEEFMRTQLTRLAGLLDEQGKDEERVAVLNFFLERYPTDRRVAQWAEQTLDSLTKIGVWERYEEAARGFLDQLAPNGAWASAQREEPGVLRTAAVFSERTLLNIINRNFTEADRLRTMPQVQHDLFVKTANDYEDFFRRFPESSETYELSFLYAELLYYRLANEGNWSDDLLVTREEFDRYLRMAGDAYRAVVELDPDPDAPHAHDAAVGALQVYDDFMVREVPDVDAPIPPPHLFEFGERRELGPAAQDYVEIVNWFANIFPDDELIPPASWRAASLFLRANQVAEAAERFETIIEHHPEHRFAQEAALAAFVCYNHVENWERIESVARRLLTVCDRVQGSEICDRDRLTGAIAYAISNQAMDLMNEGNTLNRQGETRQAQSLFLEAANKQLALYDEFPESEWAPDALFAAAATFERARQIDTAITSYRNFLASYPEHEEIPQARYVLGLIYDSQAMFREAADMFETLEAHADFESLNEALARAARLRRALSEFDRARELYREVIGLEAGSEDGRAMMFELAEMERSRGDADAAFGVFEEFRRQYASDTFRSFLALAQMAAIRADQGRHDDARRLFTQLYDAYGRGVPAMENGQMTGWSTMPGGNIEDDGQRAALVPFAARARFLEAEAAFARANGLDLLYRDARELVRKLEARDEAVLAAQAEFMEVINLGDAAYAMAAYLRVGQLYHEFYKAVYALPVPDYDECLDSGRPYEVCDAIDEAYNDALYRIGEPLLGRALSALQQGLGVAQQNRIYTRFTQELLAELNDIDRSYRTGGEEGVVADRVTDRFVSTNYILDLSGKLAAFQDFVDPATLPMDTSPYPGQPGETAPPAEDGAPEVAPEAEPADAESASEEVSQSEVEVDDAR